MHPDTAALGQAVANAAGGGKRVRPRLVGAVLSAYETTMSVEAERIAVLLEIMHTLLMVHDDVIDDDFSRRGKPNVAGEFRLRHHAPGSAEARRDGKAVALVAGDMLLILLFRLVRQLPPAHRDIYGELIEDTLLATAVGEYLDVIQSWPRQDHDPAMTRKAAYLKTTVYSFEAPLLSGMLLADAPEAHHAGVREAARYLGEAYQVIDDVLGAFAFDTVLQRGHAADLALRRETAVICAARDTTDWDEIAALRERVDTSEDLRALREALAGSGAREMALERARSLVESADGALEAADVPGALRMDLRNLLDEMVERAA